jgi:hypothetical protein
VTAYGNAHANSPNLRFAFDACLQAARDLWALADELDSTSVRVGAAHADAVVDFLGPMRVQFDDHNDTNRSQLSTVGASLRGYAGQLAADWSAARGEQDRINFSRWVEAQKAQEGIVDRVKQWFGPDKDYGSPPGNPPVPTGPAFAVTWCSPYSAYGP